jgi:putative membrane protein
MKVLGKILAIAIAVMVTSYILPGIIVENVMAAFVAAVVLALVNTFLKPLLIILTLPATIMTLGLFLLVINAILLMLVGSLVSGFIVTSFWWALFGSLIISFISSILTPKLQEKR